MKKNRQEEDEEIRRAKANIRTGFIIALIIIALIVIVAVLLSSYISFFLEPWPDMGTSVIPDIGALNKLI